MKPIPYNNNNIRTKCHNNRSSNNNTQNANNKDYINNFSIDCSHNAQTRILKTSY